jgi:hypothetical protein
MDSQVIDNQHRTRKPKTHRIPLQSHFPPEDDRIRRVLGWFSPADLPLRRVVALLNPGTAPPIHRSRRRQATRIPGSGTSDLHLSPPRPLLDRAEQHRGTCATGGGPPSCRVTCPFQCLRNQAQ